MFSLHLENFPPFSSNSKLSLANSFLKSLKFVVWERVIEQNVTFDLVIFTKDDYGKLS